MSSQSEEQAQRQANWGKLVIGTLLSLIFLWLALRGVSLAELGQALAQADACLVILALVSSTLVNIAKAIRWQAILQPQAPGVGLGRLFAALMIGQSLNTFAPLRVGDIARAYLVHGVAVPVVLYTIVVEKALDSLTLIVLLLAAGLMMPLPTWLSRSGVALSVGLAAVLVALLLVGRGKHILMHATTFLEGRLGLLRRWQATRRLGDAVAALHTLGQGRVLLPILAWTAACWVLGILANAILFPAMGIQPDQPLLAAVVLILVLYLGAVIPSSPGKLGIFHYLAIITLGLFHVPQTPALAYGIVLHLISYGPPAILGSFFIALGGLQRRENKRT